MATFPNPTGLWFQSVFETPGGVIDGANKTFTLSRTPNPKANLLLFLDDAGFVTAGKGGLFQIQGIHYTLSAMTITYATAPTAASSHRAFYRFGGSPE